MNDQPTTTAVPMAETITGLDTLAVMAGIPDPGRTVELPRHVLEDVQPPRHPDPTREEVAAYALRRCAAWAEALVAALEGEAGR